MRNLIKKMKENKLRTICIGLSAFLFGFIAVSIFNNVGDTYAVSTDPICPSGWYLDSFTLNSSDTACCPQTPQYKYGGKNYGGSCSLAGSIGDDYETCPYGRRGEYGTCWIDSIQPSQPACYVCNGNYKWGNYSQTSGCNKTSVSYDNCSGSNAVKSWQFNLNAPTSGTYGASWTSPGSGYYREGGVLITCTGSACTNKVTQLPAAKRNGYAFVGWSTDKSCPSTASFRTPMSITRNLTYYACWKPIEACYACGSSQGGAYFWGKYADSSSCALHSEYTTKSTCLANNPEKVEPQNPGDFTGGGTSSGDDTDTGGGSEEITSTIQYYKVIYDLDGGKLIDGKTSKSQYIRGDKAVGTPDTNPIKDGYSFIQWIYNDTKFDFNTKLDDIKSSLTTITENNVTLYTITLKATYIELDYSDMECPSDIVLDPSVRKCYSVLNDSSYPSYTQETYSAGTRFCYAYNNSQGKPGGIAISSTAQTDCPTTGTTGTGSAGLCKIEGKNNKTDGKYSEYGHSDVWMSENSCFVASTCTSEITNSSDCKIKWDAIIYNVSDAKIIETTLPEEPIDNDEAANTYTITYDANGGSNAPSSQTKTENVDLTLSTEKPTKSGHTFINWNTKKDGTGTSYNPGDTYKQNVSITLYAQYQKELDEDNKTYTITFWMNDGTNKKEEKVINKGDKVVKPSDPTRKGYVFDGWYDKKEKGTQYDFTKEVTSNINLYAHWKKVSNKDKTDDEITNNSKTGDILIFVAWVVGIGTLAYSVYYFKLKKDNI